MSNNCDHTKLVEEAFHDLLQYCNHSQTKENEVLLWKGFRFADNAHKGVKRKSGLPYILHPIAVAKIVAYEIGLGTEAVVTALLHDVVEDTEYTTEDIESSFGKKIAYMVDGLTKIEGVFDTEITKQAENFKKMLLTLSADIRVILIKIADRLHNMRTLEFMQEYKQIKIATETLTVFVPLAHRFGLRVIRKELETLCFKYINNADYQSVNNKIIKAEEEVQIITHNFSAPIKERLKQAGYSAQIIGRQRSIYSIWKKMQEKNCSYDELFDKLIVRIIFTPKENISEITQCWDIHHMVLKLYKPDHSKTKDWINFPRPTGYQALHTTVMSKSGHWIEVQICSDNMNRIAEHGTTASYWKNKIENNNNNSALDRWLDEVKDVFKTPETDALAFLDDFKLELYYDEIQVFTPKGDLISLPQNATILDFAYRIHSDIGNKCIGAKVNKKLQSLNYKLSNGEQVEILTLQTQKPKQNWIDLVVTARAKTKLKSFFKNQRLEKIEKGKQKLSKIFAQNEYPNPDDTITQKLLDKLDIISKEQFFLDINDDILTEKDLKRAYLKTEQKGFTNYLKGISNPFNRKKTQPTSLAPQLEKEHKKIKQIILRDDKVDKEYSIAKCCHPIPGDEIITYIDMQGKIIVHKKRCSRILQLSAKKNSGLIPAKWETNSKNNSFIANISIRGVDSKGLISKISNTVSHEHNVNMKQFSFFEKNGLFEGEIALYTPHKKDLTALINKLKKTQGIIEVKRKERN